MPFANGLVYRDGNPIAYDPADYAAGFEKMLAALDYRRWRQAQHGRRGTSKPLGIGLAMYVEGTGIGPFEGADVRVDPTGTVFLHVGVGAQGQAHETTLAQICADRLGVSVDDVVVVGGDTSVVGYGMGTIGSRVAAVAGPAVARTADEVAYKSKLVAADLFECSPDDVVLGEGRVSVSGFPDKSIPLGKLAQASVRSRRLATAGGPGLHACGFFYPGTVTWASGAHGVVIEIDLDTCAVSIVAYAATHDCGEPINPMVVEGQVLGGIAQGIGAALAEEVRYDGQGQLVTGSLMDYAVPRADSMPPVAVDHVNHPSTVNALGIKGVGESGIIAPGAAIANAVEDALSSYGLTIDRIPVTPPMLFDRLRSATNRPGEAPRPTR
jgi:aerobic carbon-monoxide dehydrogenase large subunit